MGVILEGGGAPRARDAAEDLDLALALPHSEGNTNTLKAAGR